VTCWSISFRFDLSIGKSHKTQKSPQNPRLPNAPPSVEQSVAEQAEFQIDRFGGIQQGERLIGLKKRFGISCPAIPWAA
jgi:hypothetical protein